MLEQMPIDQDAFFMRRALELAAQAEALGEVPVGALIVRDNCIIGEGFNQPISSCDATAHAEIVAIRAASKHNNNYRLVNSTLYVTLEPCTMCVGALIHARIGRLVYGTTEPKAGAIESKSRLLSNDFFNHTIDYLGGVCAEECQFQLSDFFRRRREEKKLLKMTDTLNSGDGAEGF